MRAGDCDGGLVLEAVLGELGGLGVDVDRAAVGARRRRARVGCGGERRCARRAPASSAPIAAASAPWKSTSTRW